MEVIKEQKAMWISSDGGVTKLNRYLEDGWTVASTTAHHTTHPTSSVRPEIAPVLVIIEKKEYEQL